MSSLKPVGSERYVQTASILVPVSSLSALSKVSLQPAYREPMLLFLNKGLSSSCRSFSVSLNILESECPRSSVYCKLVMVKLTVKGIKKGYAAAMVVPEVTVTEAKVDVPGVVTWAKGLPASVLKVVVVSATVGPEPVAAK